MKSKFMDVQLKRPLEIMSVIALMASFFGINLGSIFSFREHLKSLFMLDSYDLDSIFGVFLLGALAGSFFGGFIVYGSGRKIGIIVSFALAVAADCAGALAPSFSTLLLSEIVAGAACGIFMVASLIYACEISYPSLRGMLCSMPLLGFVAGLEFVIVCRGMIPVNSGVSVSFIAFIGACLVFYCLVRMPESPRWLACSRFNEAALASLIVLRGSQLVAARELALINDRQRIPDRGAELFLHSGLFRSAIWLILIMSFMIHMGGMTFIPYSALDLVCFYQQQFLGYFYSCSFDYGYGFIKASCTACFFGVLSACLLAGRISRVGSMLAGISANMFILMLLSGVAMLNLSSLSTLLLSSLILILIYVSSFTLTFFLTIFVPEFLPTAGREFGVSFALIINFAAMMACIRELRPLVATYSLGTFFAFCAGACVIFIVITSRRMPETGNGTLESLESLLFEDKLLNTRHIHSKG